MSVDEVDVRFMVPGKKTQGNMQVSASSTCSVVECACLPNSPDSDFALKEQKTEGISF